MSERSALLLVDDSASVLAFEKAALSNYYRVSTAANGREAMARVREQRPDGVVLDLSMPEMDGDEVLKALRLDPATRDMAVLILSTESQRARECLALGADDFLVKPSSPEELRARVSAVLEAAARRQASRQEAFLFFHVGSMELGLGLEDVERVLPMLALAPLPAAPDWMLGWFELEGQPVAVADFASLIGKAHSQPLIERKLLLLRQAEPRLAVCVDKVSDPEELDASLLDASSAWLPVSAEGLKDKIRCSAGRAAGEGAAGALSAAPLRLVLNASKFFSREELKALSLQLAGLEAHTPTGNTDAGTGNAGRTGRRKNRV